MVSAPFETYDVLIIGAGAAGLMCALRAGQRGQKVLLLDHAKQAGSKILVSGGGRCNFTNRQIAPDRYISDNPHFCHSALRSYTQDDFLALVRKHKISYHEKTLGQIFCDESARQIVAMLLSECQTGGVTIRLEQHIEDIDKSDRFHIRTQNGTTAASSLVLATGGLSIPQMGASNFTHQTAERFGIPLTDLRPGLVPLTFKEEPLALFRSLSGISLEVVASCGKASFRENMLFTHRGLSGPAILQISSYWKQNQTLSIDLLPNINAETLLLEQKKLRPRTELKTLLSEALPQRMAQSLCQTYFPSSPIGGLPDKELKKIAAFLHAWSLTPSGTEGYAKAEVTLGGVSTKSISSKTMEATTVPGLYVVGEALDVTGWLGGYNLQWAWSSGWAAGSFA